MYSVHLLMLLRSLHYHSPWWTCIHTYYPSTDFRKLSIRHEPPARAGIVQDFNCFATHIIISEVPLPMFKFNTKLSQFEIDLSYWNITTLVGIPGEACRLDYTIKQLEASL